MKKGNITSIQSNIPKDFTESTVVIAKIFWDMSNQNTQYEESRNHKWNSKIDFSVILCYGHC